MSGNKYKLIFFIVIFIILSTSYFFIFFGTTYTFKSKMKSDSTQVIGLAEFTKNFNINEIESIEILSDTSNVILEENNNNFIEISSKYNKNSLFSVRLQRKKLTIKQYSNNMYDDKDNEKYLLIKLPSKDFKKLKISSPILGLKINKCYFQSIKVKTKIASMNLIFEKQPKSSKLYTDVGNITLTVPKSKNNKFEIFTTEGNLKFYNQEYSGFINKVFGDGYFIFDVHCGFGSIFVY